MQLRVCISSSACSYRESIHRESSLYAHAYIQQYTVNMIEILFAYAFTIILDIIYYTVVYARPILLFDVSFFTSRETTTRSNFCTPLRCCILSV